MLLGPLKLVLYLFHAYGSRVEYGREDECTHAGRVREHVEQLDGLSVGFHVREVVGARLFPLEVRGGVGVPFVDT